MRYRLSSTPNRQAKHALAVTQGRRTPQVLDTIHHQMNRNQAMVLLGHATYVLSTSTFSRSPGSPGISLIRAYRGGQVTGTSRIHACHAAFGDPRKGDAPLRHLPGSISNRYFLGRVLSWTDLLHKGVNDADSRSEQAGLRKYGGEFLTEIARAAQGTAYDKHKGDKLVKEAFYDILVPRMQQTYAEARAKFATRQTTDEPLPPDPPLPDSALTPDAPPSLADEVIAGIHIGNWQMRDGLLLPPNSEDAFKAESAAVTERTLAIYQQYSGSVDGNCASLSVKPPVLQKDLGETVLEHIASNESKQSPGQAPSGSPGAAPTPPEGGGGNSSTGS